MVTLHHCDNALYNEYIIMRQICASVVMKYCVETKILVLFLNSAPQIALAPGHHPHHHLLWIHGGAQQNTSLLECLPENQAITSNPLMPRSQVTWRDNIVMVGKTSIHVL
jgi:hypothetical protein